MKLVKLNTMATVVLAAMSGGAVAQGGTDFSAVAGKTCRGYYDQKGGGTPVARPLAAFKFTPDKQGKFYYFR